jgi:hypothetical protein
MSADNVTPITGLPEKSQRRPRAKRPKVENTFDMPSRLRLMQALRGVCRAAECIALDSNADEDTRAQLATASSILSQMLDEHLMNTDSL